MMRAVIYCRCSTEEECQVDALKKQVEEARVCVSEQGWTLVDEFVESKSGTTTKGRREYNRLFDDLLTDFFDIIVIKSQDRLMRNTKDWYLFLDRMQSNNKKLFLYIERKFFSAEDSLITGIKAILAEEYSRELSKKMVNAHRNRQRKAESAVITNRTFGYDKLADGRVVVHEEQRDACIKLFQYVVQYGCHTTSRLLAAEGILSKSCKVMSPATIRRIVINPMYKGICVMNRRQFDFETKKSKKMPESEWIYAEGLVPPIVTPELWQCANDAVAKRSRTKMVNGCNNSKGCNAGKYVLSGKLICGSCGRPYYRVSRRTGSDKNKFVYEWKCSRYLSSGRKRISHGCGVRKLEVNLEDGCNNVSLEESGIFEALETVNVMYLQSRQFNKTVFIHKTLQILEKVLSQDKKEAKLQRLEYKICELLDKKEILLEKLLAGVVSDVDYQIQKKKFEEELFETEKDLRVYYQQNHIMENVQARLQVIKNMLENGGFERAITGQMLDYVQKIVVYEWQLEIHFGARKLHIDIPFSPNTERGRWLDRLRIMDILKSDPGTTAKKIADSMGRSQYMVWKRMQELKKDGYISYMGVGGKGIWKIRRELPDIRKRKNKNVN